MFRNLFNSENSLMATMTWVTDCIFLSLFWVLGAMLVIPFGGAGAALYDATYRGFRKGDKHCWSRFFKVFRENWMQGIVPDVLYLLGFFALCRALISLWNAAVYGEISWMVSSAGAFAAMLLGMMNLMLPMLSRFENSLGDLHGAALCPVCVSAVFPALSVGSDCHPVHRTHVQALYERTFRRCRISGIYFISAAGESALPAPLPWRRGRLSSGAYSPPG